MTFTTKKFKRNSVKKKRDNDANIKQISFQLIENEFNEKDKYIIATIANFNPKYLVYWMKWFSEVDNIPLRLECLSHTTHIKINIVI